MANWNCGEGVLDQTDIRYMELRKIAASYVRVTGIATKSITLYLPNI
jgi:hypothetical protein